MNDGNAPEEEEEEDAALPDLTASGATAAEEATIVPTDDARLDGASPALAETTEAMSRTEDEFEPRLQARASLSHPHCA